MARSALRLHQADVAARAGISKTAFNDLETGYSSPRVATLTSIQRVLEREGAVFSADGSVRIEKKADRFIVEPGQNPSAETLQAAMAIVAAARKMRERLP